MSWFWTRFLLSNNNPQSEKMLALPGSGSTASRNDHAHPRISSTTAHVLGANNEATVVFTREFDGIPGTDFMWQELADNPPIIFKVKSWTINGSGKYTGCVVKAYRSQPIPQNLVSLLLGGVFNIFAGSAVGVNFTAIALQQSTTP